MTNAVDVPTEPGVGKGNVDVNSLVIRYLKEIGASIVDMLDQVHEKSMGLA
jgi:hypothetical protein